MDEMGKWFVSVVLMGLGGLLIILSLILGARDLIVVISGGAAMMGFGGVIYCLRHFSMKSQTRKKAVVTRVVREVPKPKPKPVVKEEPVEEKPKRPEILCDTCQFYMEYRTKQKCKFLSDKERLAMINQGIECVEYKIKLTLLD